MSIIKGPRKGDFYEMFAYDVVLVGDNTQVYYMSSTYTSA